MSSKSLGLAMHAWFHGREGEEKHWRRRNELDQRVGHGSCLGRQVNLKVTKRFWFSKNNAFHGLKPQLLLMQLLIILPLIPSFLVCMIQTYVNTSNDASLWWEQCCVRDKSHGAGDLSWKPFCPWSPLCILKQLLEWGFRYLFGSAQKRNLRKMMQLSFLAMSSSTKLPHMTFVFLLNAVYVKRLLRVGCFGLSLNTLSFKL